MVVGIAYFLLLPFIAKDMLWQQILALRFKFRSGLDIHVYRFHESASVQHFSCDEETIGI